MPILKLSKDDPKKEMDFELTCNLNLTLEQRLTMHWRHSVNMLKLAKIYATRKTFTVVKRT